MSAGSSAWVMQGQERSLLLRRGLEFSVNHVIVTNDIYCRAARGSRAVNRNNTALLILDLVSEFQFEGAHRLLHPQRASHHGSLDRSLEPSPNICRSSGAVVQRMLEV